MWQSFAASMYTRYGKMATKEIKVILKKRPATERLRVILLGIGLKKIDSSKVLSDTPAVRGMLSKVSHLISVEEAL